MNLKIIENFLKIEDLQLINSVKLFKPVGNKGIAIYHNKITKDGFVDAELFDENFLKSIYKTPCPLKLRVPCPLT